MFVGSIVFQSERLGRDRVVIGNALQRVFGSETWGGDAIIQQFGARQTTLGMQTCDRIVPTQCKEDLERIVFMLKKIGSVTMLGEIDT